MNAAPELQQLADHIGRAVKLAPGAMAREIQAALKAATSTPTWLPLERRRASHENYARHLLYSDPEGRFSVLSLVWDHGQRSPVHGHYCWCAVGVYQGRLTETSYQESFTGGLPALVGKTPRGVGSVSFEPAASGIHRISNDSGEVAISLHVYGVPRENISIGVNRIYT
jgi:predicted metal-dependent enzyme (double-stranded beta helix superfamily)